MLIITIRLKFGYIVPKNPSSVVQQSHLGYHPFSSLVNLFQIYLGTELTFLDSIPPDQRYLIFYTFPQYIYISELIPHCIFSIIWKTQMNQNLSTNTLIFFSVIKYMEKYLRQQKDLYNLPRYIISPISNLLPLVLTFIILNC